MLLSQTGMAAPGAGPGRAAIPVIYSWVSEGTLGLFEEIELSLSPIPKNKALGYVTLKPSIAQWTQHSTS